MKYWHLLILLIVLFPVSQVSSTDTVCEIRIDPAGSTGEILPLLGVNAGPAPVGDPDNPDLTRQYQDIGVLSVRNHDIYHAHSMSLIYPDRTCNPQDRTCYNFTTSDATFEAITDGGFEPYFRIGDGYEAVNPPSPAEQEYWSDAAVQTIRHYREGLWDGFTSDIRYVEIWNEPDYIHFWPKPHTREEFFNLYAMTAKKIKLAFPDLLIGGPGLTQQAVTTGEGKRYVRSFLRYMQENSVPVDFLSWHIYSNNPADYEKGGLLIDSILDESGFGQSENHLTEYNTQIEKETYNDRAFDLRAGSPGSAILTACWISLQNSGVDQAFVYRGNDPSITFPQFYGIFYADGRPKKTALAFSLWSAVSGYQNRLPLQTNENKEGVFALAGRQDNGDIGILISNTNHFPQNIVIRINDENYQIQQGLLVSDLSITVQEIQIQKEHVTMPPFSVLFMRAEKN
ncbi:MAG: hypothetical protein JXA44_01485 [Methanospirillaceae archaeon]|nr:hypothetical protein [Methanospirillaceae archaeon]